jgi:hypothetical protein
MDGQNREFLTCKCGAPIDINTVTQDPTKPIQCLFCGLVFTLRERQDDAQKIKQELKAWVEKLLVGGGSGAADVHSRHLIFNEYTYPALKSAIDQYLENIEDVFEGSLVHVKPMTDFSDYQPSPVLVAIGKGDTQRLKILSASVSTQEVQDFAVMPTDRLQLKQLQLRVQSIIYHANIAHQLAEPSGSSHKIVRQNLVMLQKEYQEHARDIVDDDRYRSYVVALDARLRGDILLLDVLIPVLDEGYGVAPEATLNRLGRAITQLEKARQQASACTYNSLYTVPLQQGIQKDIDVARVFETIVKCYEVVTRTQPVEFGLFYERLTTYIHGLAKIQSANDLLWLLTSVQHFLKARSGDASVPALKDWSWLDQAMESTRRKALFGLGGEKTQIILRHYHPYWVIEVKYTEPGGLFSKKGIPRDGLILMDATSLDTPVEVLLLAGAPFLPLIRASTYTSYSHFLDKQVMALPALVRSDMAERAVKAYARQHMAELKITNIRIMRVVYLPVASIRYTDKHQSRESIVGALNGVNQNLSNVLRQTQQFLQTYNS